MPCMWYTMVSRCHGWCSVTSGHVLTWWTVSSHAPPRKQSSLFSWPRPLLSAWSSTWLNLRILSPRLSLGRGINQSDSLFIIPSIIIFSNVKMTRCTCVWVSDQLIQQKYVRVCQILKSFIVHLGYQNAQSPSIPSSFFRNLCGQKEKKTFRKSSRERTQNKTNQKLLVSNWRSSNKVDDACRGNIFTKTWNPLELHNYKWYTCEWPKAKSENFLWYLRFSNVAFKR